MTALSDMKRFYRFLDEASDSQLSEKRELLVRFLDEARDPDVIRDAAFLLKKVEAEMLSRL
ncbi:MAG TPA: hypothetical protein ENI94_02490 [Gammaproteobacteria bacterium]|nr:hypothetical protein [Gammaproteobacteria bacterium]